jgi:sugar phosphate isomerase/epimerase
MAVKPKIALQLYTVRQELQRDFLGTIAKVAQIGYPAVQFAGYGGLSAAELKKALAGLGLAVGGSHVNLEALEQQPDREINYCLDVGTPDVIIPVMPQAWRGSSEGYRRLADTMNRLGARCKELGARLSYHNHAFEFEKLGDRYPLDLLFDWCDPELVKWEPDIYWVKYGQEDPAAYIRKYAGRTPVVHLKDMTAGSSPTYAEVGEGILDWPSIFAASEASGAEWYVVEQDQCARPPLESAALSLQHLREWGKL